MPALFLPWGEQTGAKPVSKRVCRFLFVRKGNPTPARGCDLPFHYFFVHLQGVRERQTKEKQNQVGRLLAVDYGTKRVGLAVSDCMQIIATKLATVPTADIFPYLKEYVSAEQVDAIVVGNPKQMNNMPSESAKAVHSFVDKLAKTFPNIKIHMLDERFTSKMASRAIAQSGLSKKKRQDKALIDSVAAVIILQDFMQMQK